MEDLFDYSQWSGAELAKAENTAGQFLDENQKAISQVFFRQSVLLERFAEFLNRDGLTLEQRLDCFARIAELARSVEDCAKGFFDLGSQPVVARLLAEADPR
ncbi:MAG TPA: hypothetical protein VHB50_01455 [Bryobacteraceae bacterium]|nr:hypothetical protein [Bryobacteraceae bacterium]